MNEEVMTRVAAVQMLSDPLAGWMPWPQLLELEAFLRDTYGIVQLPERLDWERTLDHACSADVAIEFRKINRQRARLQANRQPFPYALENRFYDLIAQRPLFGLVHSQKHSFIFDAAAYLLRVARAAQITGPALDLGCNGGYHAAWLAMKGPVSGIVGVDRSARTVEFARSVAAELELGERVEFERLVFPGVLQQRSFDLVYSVDGAIGWDQPSAWAAAEQLLAPDGVLVWIGDAGKAVRPATSLGCLIADVVGGWNGASFDAKVALVLMRTQKSHVTGDPAREASRFWDEGFKSFANSGVAPRWKTQAFCRAWLAQGEPPVRREQA